MTLEANPTTGFRWELLEAAGGVLALSGTPRFEPRTTAGMAGTGGSETWRFRAERAGRGVLRLVYRRPFEPAVAPAREVRYEIVVR